LRKNKKAFTLRMIEWQSRSMPPGEDDRMAEPFDATRRGEDGSRSETDEV